MDTQKHIPLEADIISQVMLMGKEKCLELVLGGTSVKGWPTPQMFYRPVAAGVIPAHPSSGPFNVLLQ